MSEMKRLRDNKMIRKFRTYIESGLTSFNKLNNELLERNIIIF